MENPTPASDTQRFAPKKIKSVDVRRLKRNGYSVKEIAAQMGITTPTVYFHLKKKNKVEKTPSVEVKSAKADTVFEAELFGTLLRLDSKPASIEKIGNRIVIK